MRLSKHAEFFVLLDGTGDEAWSGEFLLKTFGAAMLRRFELPVRWLQRERAVSLSALDKVDQADARRARNALATTPEGTVARSLLDEFSKELERRCDAGTIARRSIRMAIRPAVALLAVEDPQGTRAPGQAALERYLASTPGQRAALSTFLGFLKSNHGIGLRLPAKQGANSPGVRKTLEKQIAALMAPAVDTNRVAKQWAPLALRYFHHLSVADARAICMEATREINGEGTVLTYRGQAYWIPANPNTDPPLSRDHSLA